jgi:hypothetical protein
MTTILKSRKNSRIGGIGPKQTVETPLVFTIPLTDSYILSKNSLDRKCIENNFLNTKKVETYIQSLLVKENNMDRLKLDEYISANIIQIESLLCDRDFNSENNENIENIKNDKQKFGKMVGLLLFIFYGPLFFSTSFFQLYVLREPSKDIKIKNINKNYSKKNNKYHNNNKFYNYEGKKGGKHYDTFPQLTPDDRRLIMGVKICNTSMTPPSGAFYSTGRQQDHQFMMKMSLNPFYSLNYEQEIKIYNELKKRKEVLQFENMVLNHFVPSQTVPRHSSLSDVRTFNFNLGYNNSLVGINIDFDYHKKKILAKDQTPADNVVCFATEWNPAFIPFSQICENKSFDFSDEFIVKVLKKMILNIIQLNEVYGFYHGDLHLENFLCNYQGDIRRFDFDFSGILTEQLDLGFERIENTDVFLYYWDGLPVLVEPTTEKIRPDFENPDILKFMIYFDILRMLASFSSSFIFGKSVDFENIESTCHSLVRQVCVQLPMPYQNLIVNSLGLAYNIHKHLSRQNDQWLNTDLTTRTYWFYNNKHLNSF